MKIGNSPGSRRVAAIDLTFQTLPNFEAVRDYLLLRLLAARRQQAQLVVMPAFTGLLTMHLFAGSVPSTPGQLRDVVFRFGIAMEETLLDWACQWARTFEMFLVPGTCLIPSPAGLLHRAHVIAPDGRVLGYQDQTHIRTMEQSIGLVGGNDLKVWDLDGLRLGLAIGSDAWTPEVGAILAWQGTNLLACPTAVPEPYTQQWQMAGIWQQVQDNRFYGLECALHGDLAGYRFQGRSSILAPIQLARERCGYLSDAEYSGRGVVTADLDLLRLLENRTAVLHDRIHKQTYAASLPQLYRYRITG